jgi:hypothetical protein
VSYRLIEINTATDRQTASLQGPRENQSLQQEKYEKVRMNWLQLFAFLSRKWAQRVAKRKTATAAV